MTGSDGQWFAAEPSKVFIGDAKAPLEADPCQRPDPISLGTGTTSYLGLAQPQVVNHGGGEN
jgi:hypothetical protein